MIQSLSYGGMLKKKKTPFFSLRQNPLKVKSGTGWPQFSMLQTQYSKSFRVEGGTESGIKQIGGVLPAPLSGLKILQ